MGGIKAHTQGEENLLSQEIIPIFKFNLKVKGGFARIIPLGDIHYGHRACMVEKVKGFINYIERTPDTYVILMADLMENVLPATTQAHPGCMWEQKLSPAEQYAGMLEMLSPLAETKKILFALGGTHSARSWYATEHDPEEELAKALHVPYSALDGIALITVGKQEYRVHAVHGTGSTADPAAVMRKIMMQAKRVASADLYLRGHHHSKVVATEYRFNAETGKAEKSFYVGTGSFLGYVNTYAQRSEYHPAVPGAVKIKLYKATHDIHITV